MKVLFRFFILIVILPFFIIGGMAKGACDSIYELAEMFREIFD